MNLKQKNPKNLPGKDPPAILETLLVQDTRRDLFCKKKIL